jgi:hypothetical protein
MYALTERRHNQKQPMGPFNSNGQEPKSKMQAGKKNKFSQLSQGPE